MSYCYICGYEKDLVFRKDVLKFACIHCSKGTPGKVGRDRFYRAYFGNEPVKEAIKREFYDDYKSSRHTLDEYIHSTREVIE